MGGQGGAARRLLKGAGQDKADERPTFTIDQVFAVADAIQPYYRLLVLLGALMSLRFGEFAALRRRDVDPDGFSEPGPDGLVFVGPNGGRLRRRNVHRLWAKALTDAGVKEQDVHFHDLRHTGNALAAATGASTKELMARMGHVRGNDGVTRRTQRLGLPQLTWAGATR
jgi:integrase